MPPPPKKTPPFTNVCFGLCPPHIHSELWSGGLPTGGWGHYVLEEPEHLRNPGAPLPRLQSHSWLNEPGCVLFSASSRRSAAELSFQHAQAVLFFEILAQALRWHF